MTARAPSAFSQNSGDPVFASSSEIRAVFLPRSKIPPELLDALS
jgi:hypothetical protein